MFLSLDKILSVLGFKEEISPYKALPLGNKSNDKILQYKSPKPSYYVLKFNEGFYELYISDNTNFYYYKNGSAYKQLVLFFDNTDDMYKNGMINLNGEINVVEFCKQLSKYSDEFKVHSTDIIRLYKLEKLLK